MTQPLEPGALTPEQVEAQRAYIKRFTERLHPVIQQFLIEERPPIPSPDQLMAGIVNGFIELSMAIAKAAGVSPLELGMAYRIIGSDIEAKAMEVQRAFDEARKTQQTATPKVDF